MVRERQESGGRRKMSDMGGRWVREERELEERSNAGKRE
jgi:hypothetical protein